MRELFHLLAGFDKQLNLPHHPQIARASLNFN